MGEKQVGDTVDPDLNRVTDNFSTDSKSGADSGKMLKFRSIERQGDLIIKKKKPGDFDVEKKMISFFQGHPSFRVPKMFNGWSNDDDLVIHYVPGMQLTRFFKILDRMNGSVYNNVAIKNLKFSPLEVKAMILNEIIDDMGIFQSHNDQLASMLGKHCEPYPYVKKTIDSFDAAIESLRYFSNAPAVSNAALVRKDLETIAQYLSLKAKYVFRDVIVDNILFNKPELDGLSDDEAAAFLSNTLKKEDGLDQLRNRLYHIDFETSKNTVTKPDDLIHVLEHQMCSIDGVKPYGSLALPQKDELYHMTAVARMFRFWSRRCVYLVEESRGAAQRYPGETPAFYMNKVIDSLDYLRVKDGKRFDNLYNFCLSLKNIDYSRIVDVKN